MFYPNDVEIMGGFGFDNDQYASTNETEYSLYSNGSRALDKDPYIPILQERMGLDWNSNNFASSLTGAGEIRNSQNTKELYPYKSIKGYVPGWPNPNPTVENLLSNFPTFQQTEPFTTSTAVQWLSNTDHIIIIILIFIIAIVVAVSHYANKRNMRLMQKILKKMKSQAK